MGCLRVVLLAAMAGAAIDLPMRAQTAARGEPAAALAERYRVLVVEYQSGDAIRAIRGLAAWSVANTLTVQRHANWPPDVLRLAAMLETEAAIGNRASFGPLGARLDLAAEWIVMADRRPAGAPSGFRRRWYLAVGRWLIANGFDEIAGQMLDRACRDFPDDGELLLALGTALETLVHSYGVDIAAPQSTATAVRKRRADTLAAAKAALEKAVRAQAAPIEARLRLAHVHVLEGADDRARPLLEAVLTTGAPAPVAYLSSLMLGEIRARRGELPAAIALFLEARRHVPSGQSAYLAQAHALRAAGQVHAAAVVLEEMLGRARQDSDPWMQYLVGFDEVAPRLNALLSEVRR